MSATEVQQSRTPLATSSYRAAVVHDFGEPLVVEQVPRPSSAPARSWCGWRRPASATRTSMPLTATGRSSRRHRSFPGTKVSGSSSSSDPASPRSGSETGSRCRGSAMRAATCDYCVSGWETLCLEQKNMGYSIDGGFGEYATAYARYVVQVPDGVDPFDAAPLTCAGVTTYKAVKVAGTRSSDLVAVFGVGGLGHMAIQYARIAGGRVVAVDLTDEKLELAGELGAEFTVNAAKEDPAAAIQRLGGADQAIALAVSPRSFEQASGRCAARDARLRRAAGGQRRDAPDLRDRAQRYHRRRVDRGHTADLREVFELHAAGKTEGHPRGRVRSPR